MVDTVGKTQQVLMYFKALKYHLFVNHLISNKVSSNNNLHFVFSRNGLIIHNS